MIEAKIHFSAKTRTKQKMEFIVADVVIFAISVLGLVLAVEMVDAINKNRNG